MVPRDSIYQFLPGLDYPHTAYADSMEIEHEKKKKNFCVNSISLWLLVGILPLRTKLTANCLPCSSAFLSFARFIIIVRQPNLIGENTDKDSSCTYLHTFTFVMYLLVSGLPNSTSNDYTPQGIWSRS